MIADDYALNLGTLDDTGYVIESRIEENSELFEMITNALDLTLTNTGEMYVLYDDFGKLTLKSLSSMYVGVPGAYLMIDEETGQDFEYTSSIDSNTYNKIKLTYDNEDTKSVMFISHRILLISINGAFCSILIPYRKVKMVKQRQMPF